MLACKGISATRTIDSVNCIKPFDGYSYFTFDINTTVSTLSSLTKLTGTRILWADRSSFRPQATVSYSLGYDSRILVIAGTRSFFLDIPGDSI